MRFVFKSLLCAMLMVSPFAGSRADIDTSGTSSSSTFELVVIEAEGCIYCALFRRDVLPTYEASNRAQEMPVRFVDINDIAANHLDFKSEVDIVPTFVVVKSRHEVGRVSGYVGPEDLFHSISYLLASAP